ncbi:MAG TPA: hypothetical protein PLD43_04535, partial [Anaerolineae bacterium]|nr:hypothetical protein [Anaerolineae bacterium]
VLLKVAPSPITPHPLPIAQAKGYAPKRLERREVRRQQGRVRPPTPITSPPLPIACSKGYVLKRLMRGPAYQTRILRDSASPLRTEQEVSRRGRG